MSLNKGDLTHILYLTYDGLTDNLGRSQIIPYLNVLQNSEYQVHVISADKRIHYGSRKGKVKEQLANGIDWISIPYTKSPPILSTFLDLKRMRLKAFQLLKKFPIKIVHVRSYPPMEIALRLKRRFAIKVIFDMRGFYPEERIEGGIWRKSHFLHNYLFSHLKRRERHFVHSSDHIVSLTNAAKSILVESFRSDEAKITVIPCCADFGHFRVIENERDDEVLNLVYLGSLGTWYLVPEMLRLFKRILDTNENSYLTIFTGDDTSEVHSLCAELGIEDSKVKMDSVDRERLPEELSKFDMSLFFIKPSYSKQASSPTKLAELLACGIPVLCNEEVGDIKIHSGRLLGIRSVPLSRLESMDIEKMIAELLDIDRSEIRSSARQYFDISVAEKSYLDIFYNLLDGQ